MTSPTKSPATNARAEAKNISPEEQIRQRAYERYLQRDGQPGPEQSAAPAASASYVWRLPGKRVSVRLSLDVVERLGFAIVEGFKSLPKRGLEVGGLLLGCTETQEDGTVTTVQDFEPFQSEHRNGPSYILSDKDQEKLQEAIALPKDEGGERRVVGFYRSQTRPEFEMSIEDAAIMSRFFSDPAQVFLLLKPSASEPGVAGFFIWEDGTIHRESTYLPFPFQNSELRSGRFPVVEFPVVEQPAPRQPVPPGKPRMRHFDTRRMMEEFTHDPQSPRPQLAAPAKKVRTKALYVGMATALIVVAALLLFQIAPRPGTTSRGLPLALNVAWEGNRLRLTWNRKAPAIRSASRGVLSTTDGARQQLWNLDTTQLTEGSIVYWPVTNDVNFRLDVFSHENRVGESVRSLGMPPESVGGPQPVTQSAPPSGAPKLALPVQNRAAARTRGVGAVRSGNDGEPVAYAKPSLLNSDSIPTVPQPLQSSSTPPAPNPAPERRPLEVVPPKTVAQEPVEEFSNVTWEPAGDSRIGQVFGKVPLIRRLRKPSTYAPPKPLREVSPVVPSELRRGIRGQVPIDVKVYVNESGRVDYAELISEGTGPNRSLASQAVYAARRWEFEPAREGERKVPGQVILHYRFGHTQMASQK